MRYLALAALIAITACGTTAPRMVDIDYETPPPADWPVLEERLHFIAQSDVPKYCYNLGADAKRAASCAVTSFRYGVCYLYVATTAPAGALEHERAHCKGYGHVGDALAPAKAWQQFKASGRRVGEG